MKDVHKALTIPSKILMRKESYGPVCSFIRSSTFNFFIIIDWIMKLRTKFLIGKTSIYEFVHAEYVLHNNLLLN